MKRIKIRKYLIITGIILFILIRIDNKSPHVFKSRMSPTIYMHFHNTLSKIQIGSKRGYATVSSGIDAGKEELLDARYKDVRGLFIKPMQGYHISCDFGFRFHPIFFFPEWHRGVDMACDEGNPVYAIYSGIVIAAGEK